MKLYAAFVIYDYEGGKLLGVFSTRVWAERAINNIKKEGFGGDSQEIHEIELNEDTEIYI